MSFLRPMGLPRPATIRQFMHFSTSTRCLAAQQVEGMLIPVRQIIFKKTILIP